MYQELLAWTGADPKVSPDALPEVLTRALHSAFQHQCTSNPLPLFVAAHAASNPAAKGKNVDRISLATFVVALCIVAMQVRFSTILMSDRVSCICIVLQRTNAHHTSLITGLSSGSGRPPPGPLD